MPPPAGQDHQTRLVGNLTTGTGEPTMRAMSAQDVRQSLPGTDPHHRWAKASPGLWPASQALALIEAGDLSGTVIPPCRLATNSPAKRQPSTPRPSSQSSLIVAPRLQWLAAEKYICGYQPNQNSRAIITKIPGWPHRCAKPGWQSFDSSAAARANNRTK